MRAGTVEEKKSGCDDDWMTKVGSARRWKASSLGMN